jgi:AcrR family transcriptional regulator
MKLQHDGVKDKLLQAGIEAFTNHGFKGTSLRDISTRVGVPVSIIAYYYDNKEGLYRAVYDHLERTVTAYLEPARTELDRVAREPGLSPFQARTAIRHYVASILEAADRQEPAGTPLRALMKRPEQLYRLLITDSLLSVTRVLTADAELCARGVIGQVLVMLDSAEGSSDKLKAATLLHATGILNQYA